MIRLTRGNEGEGGAGVDNTGGGREDRRAAIGDGLVDAPVLRGGRGARDGTARNRRSERVHQAHMTL